jgi:hypothetical protein
MEEKQEVDGGGRGSCSGGRRKQSRGGRDVEGVQRKKKEEQKSKGSCVKLKRSRDFPVK